MSNTPLDWGTVIHHSTMANIKEVLNVVNALQKALHHVWLQEQWRERGYPQGEKGKSNSQDAKWTFKVEWECTNMGKSLPDPWGMSSLEGYQDSGRDKEHKALLSNKGPGGPTQTQQQTLPCLQIREALAERLPQMRGI